MIPSPGTNSKELRAGGGGTATPIPPKVPDHELVRRIGQGSYGEVWLARNAIGTFRAVKFVFRHRFKEERPYEREFSGIQTYEPISRSNEGLVDVLQIGRNEAEGYFYYVMELADDAGDGTYVPKTLASEIRARGRLPVRECITLGLNLNLALAHLHRHGLIHRDVKPSNIIFVSGVPKLADIGLVTEVAEAQSFVGTEGFIPPEGPNSPQADIYALGKVLYEASMGKDRHDFPEPYSGLGTDQDAKNVMELNAVLLKACAPKPRERYRSAEEMNADLALLHSGESVQQKHVLQRRVKVLTRVGVGLAAALVLGAFPYYVAIKEAQAAKLEASLKTKALNQARIKEQEARKSEARANAILQFFEKQILAAPRPKGEPRGLGKDVTVRDALIQAETAIPLSFTNEPVVEAYVRGTLGETFIYRGDYALGLEQLERSLALLRANLGSDHEETLTVMNNLALAYANMGDFQKALPLAEETMRHQQAMFGETNRDTLIVMHLLATIYHNAGRDQDALPLEKETFDLRKTHLGLADEDTLSSMDHLGTIYRELGRLPEAISLQEQELAIARTNFSADHPAVLVAMGNLASSYQVAGRIEEALPLREAVLKQRRLTYGPEAPQTLISQHNLAKTYVDAGHLEEGITLHEETLCLRRLKLGEDHPDTMYSMHNTASAYAKAGRLPEAIALYEDVLEKRIRKIGPDHPDTLGTMRQLALAYVDLRQFSKATSLSELALGLARAKYNPDDPAVLSGERNLAAIHKAQNAQDEPVPAAK